MIARISQVTHVQQTGTVKGNIYRSPLIPSIDSNAISIDAASLGLLRTVGTTVAQGSYLNAATAQEPVAVLGAAAAQRLGIDRVYSGERIWVDNRWFYVAGILKPAVLASNIHSSVLVGFGAAEHHLGFDRHPSNTMIISVLERRSEIGLRRALGATRGHIRVQFLAEAVLLALLGGAVGVGTGALTTAVYASAKHELVVILPLPGAAAWAPPYRSAPSPGSGQRFAPLACHPPKRC
jgi:hypothetical protein